MEMQEVEITIDKEGKVRFLVRGTQGEGCLAITRTLENAVGAPDEREYTAEYYEQPASVSDRRTVSR